MHLDNTFINKKMESSKAFIRGQCHEAQENKANAVEAYQEALHKDYTNAEAFNRLVDGQLVSGVQKELLLKNINFK
jgi:anaphase-promoting complex subunit 6